MTDVNLIVVLVVAGTAMALFATGRLRIDLIALSVLVALVALRLINANQALYGLTSPATTTIAAMFVLSAGLARTGLVQWIAQKIDKLAGKTEPRLVFALCAVVGALSAFVVNTAIVAIFIPIAIVLAKTRRISSSRVLMPLSFASQFGGVCTLIGTSTNILVNSIAINAGMRGFSLFEFAPLGLAMSAAGIVYLMIVPRHLLPKRRGEAEQVDKYRLADYLTEMRVVEKSPLIGKTWETSKVGRETEIELTNFFRNDEPTSNPKGTKIREGDVLLLNGNVDVIIGTGGKYGLELQKDVEVDDRKLSSDEVKLVEALIPPRSNLIGRTLETSDLLRRHKLTALAIQRRGKTLRERLADIRLEDGDTLLLQGNKECVNHLLKSSDLIVTNELTELYFRKDRAIIALAMVVTVVTLVTLNIFPIFIAALIGAVGVVLGRCITMEEAYLAIDWKVIFLLVGILPLGLALEQNGAALWLANTVIGPFADFGPLMVLAVLYLITATLTESMSNVAAAGILAPIGLSFAVTMNVDPRPFLVAITFAASTSFATPVGYQTNTMIYAPGGYRFTDFTRVGGPLNLIFLGLAVLLIPRLWPF